MKKDNRGLTLVELLVGIVIFGIITAAVLSFLTMSSRTYSRINGSMNQRLDGQLAVNQIESYLIDCNESVSFSAADSTLTIVSTDGGAETTFVYKLSDGEILFGANGAESATDLLTDNVTDFKVVFGPVAAEKADYATITLKTENRGNELELQKTVALRNHPEIK